ncbi:hypothetical protein ZOSMA_29G01160 [Zostera marina]|uniref:Uncharacterized protein n=1 Tax=Zostera marina TaxID=29655 RepID=A0A0K9PE10_ZOSMR|nr:hypothetical protein ZOSMA_29G01160 [Zostera marina]
MKAAVPYLLFRNLSDPSDSPDEKGLVEIGKVAQDPHKVHSSDVSFCKIATGEGGSPLSLSPNSLCLNVKEMKKASPRSIDSSEFFSRVWGQDKKEREEGGVDDTDRVLSLRDLTDASAVDGDRWKGEEVEKGGFGHGGAGATSSSAVGVSLG